MKNKTAQLALIMALVIFPIIMISGCDDNKKTESTAVGMVLPLSGSLGTLGAGLRNAAELALEEVNAFRSNKIKFIIEDSKSTADGAAEAFNKLIGQDGVTSIIGPATSSATQLAFPIAQQSSVVAFSPLAAARGLSEIGDYVFQGNLSVDAVIPGGVELTSEKFGYEKVAVLVDEIDLFSQSAYEILEAAFDKKGIEILSKETLETDDTDFSEQLARIKDLEPNAIFISTLPNEAVGILTQVESIGISEDIKIIIPLAFSTGEIETAGEAAEGVVTFSTWISTAETPGNQDFVNNYQLKFGSEPSRFLAQEYAAVHIFAQAFFSAESTDAFAIRDALIKIKNFDTILGKFSFNENGQAVYDPIILEVKNKKFEVLEFE